MPAYNHKQLDTKIFCEKLKLLLESKGMQGQELASEIDTTPATISRYVTNARDPNLEYVYRIAKYFRVSIDWLLGIADDRLDALSPEIRKFAELYSKASAGDQEIIRVILKKYEKD